MARDSYDESPHRTRRKSRRERREKESAHRDEEVDYDALDIEELRRTRQDYYAHPPEERRTRPSRRLDEMPSKSRTPGARPSPHRSVRRRPPEHRRRRGEGELVWTRKRREVEEDGDSGVYVYHQHHAHREAEAGRDDSGREEAAEGQVDEVEMEEPPKAVPRRKTTRKRADGTRHRSTRRRTVVASSSPIDLPRRAAEEDEESDHKRRHRKVGSEGSDDEQTVPGAFVYGEEAVKPKRSASTHTHHTHHTTKTQASLHRMATTKTRAPLAQSRHAAPLPSIAEKTAASTAAIKERRKSTGGGLLATLFGPPPPLAPTKKIECVICMGDDIPVTKAARLSCGHRMCHGCLKRQFQLSVTDPQHMPPRCCTEDHIPLRHVERLFDVKFKKLWNRKYQEYSTKNRVYCPMKGCGEWIKPKNIVRDEKTGREYGKCSKCQHKVCVLCNGKWHRGKDCPNDEETRQLVEMSKEKGWQRCYNCKAMVELKEGCNHMTCRCTAQFCMLCGAKWKTCDCPWFNYTNLDAGDRLNDMNIPHRAVPIIPPLHVATPPTPPVPPGAYPMNPPPPVSRRAQEAADEALARRLQNQLFLDDLTASANASGTTADMNMEAFGLARRHFMNENYRVHAVPPPPPVGVVELDAAAAGHISYGPTPLRRNHTQRTATRARLTRERGVPQTQSRQYPRASAMAGLARDGSRRGAARVGGWLNYVINDPAEVEGRNMMGIPGY